MRNYSENSGCGSVIFLFLICVVIIVISLTATFNTSTYNSLTVTDKSYAGSEDSFIIWMEDAAGNQYEFTNKDQWLRGKFNSSTVQGKIKVGNVYNIKTCGWRVPLFSWYENIIEYTLVEDKSVDNN